MIVAVWLATAHPVPGHAAYQDVPVDGHSRFHFANVDEARTVLGSVDDWVRAFGPLDAQIRVESREPVTDKQFLEYAAEQAREWSDDDVAKLTEVVEFMRSRVDSLGLHLHLPERMLIVKTTGQEEGGDAAYTRANAIILPQGLLTRDVANLEHIMLHETFHLLTRHNPKLRVLLYRIVGFQPCNELEYPKALLPRKITNPDAFHFDTYIQVTVEGRRALVMPLTLSKETVYHGGGLFDYVTVELLEVEMHSGVVQAVMKDGVPVLYQMGAVQDYWNQIGGNTRYVIHAEEIMADNFSLAVRGKTDVANPEMLTAVLELLSE